MKHSKRLLAFLLSAFLITGTVAGPVFAAQANGTENPAEAVITPRAGEKAKEKSDIDIMTDSGKDAGLEEEPEDEHPAETEEEAETAGTAEREEEPETAGTVEKEEESGTGKYVEAEEDAVLEEMSETDGAGNETDLEEETDPDMTGDAEETVEASEAESPAEDPGTDRPEDAVTEPDEADPSENAETADVEQAKEARPVSSEEGLKVEKDSGSQEEAEKPEQSAEDNEDISEETAMKESDGSNREAVEDPEVEDVSETAADSTVQSGTWDGRLTWTLDEEGILTVSGTGATWNDFIDEELGIDINAVKKAILEEGISDIRWGAFYGCKNMTEVTIPTSAKRIDESAFEECDSLTSVVLPEGVEEIGNLAFAFCNNLASVTIPASVTSIDEYAFGEYPSITIYGYTNSYAERYANDRYIPFVSIGEVERDPREDKCGPDLEWEMDDKGALTISGVGGMYDYNNSDRVKVPWSACAITSVIIEDGVSSIGSYAFFNCSQLEFVTVPDSVTSIGASAFPAQDAEGLILFGNAGSFAQQYADENHMEFRNVSVAKSIKGAVITVEDQEYTGAELTPVPTVVLDGTVLIYSTDFTVSYSENIDKGTAYITVTGIGNYYGTETGSFHITEAHSGSCGESLFWTIDEGGTLVISGTGNMYGYDPLFDDESPWYWPRSEIRKIVIEPGAASIGAYSFIGCGNLTSVSFPEGITRIGSHAFENCDKLTEITGLDTIEYIGTYAFEGTPWQSAMGDFAIKSHILFRYQGDAQEVSIPDGVTYIGDGAFRNSNVENVVISDTVTGIGFEAFENCWNLSSLTIPPSVKTIGGIFGDDEAFGEELVIYGYRNSQAHLFALDHGIHFESLGTVDLSGICGADLTWTLNAQGMLTIRGEGEMDCHPWSEYRGDIKTVVIEEGVTTIAGEAFYYCLNLENVTIPSSVTNIGYWAFNHCVSLVDVVIPEGVTSIGTYAFSGCEGLTDIIIPRTVQSMGDGVFYGCRNLSEIVVEAGVTSIEQGAFRNCGLRSIIIPEGVTNIQDRAFYQCAGLTDVSIPSSVASIGEEAFYECGKLESVEIPFGVTSIGNSAFWNCNTMEFVTFPASVTDIGESAFAWCENIMSVTLPESIVRIGKYAFADCTSLEEVILPSTGIDIDGSVFQNTPWQTAKGEMVIEDGFLKLYQGDGEEIVIPEGVTEIGDGAFSHCESMRKAVIPEGVTGIGNGAFSYCENLSEVVIPESVTSIGEEAFLACRNLKDIDLPSSVERIGRAAFCDCENLAGITIPQKLTVIEEGVFEDCDRLSSIEIPEGVTGIGNRAFYSCGNLAGIIIPVSVESIGIETFKYCWSLERALIPTGVNSIGSCAFDDCSENLIIFGYADSEAERYASEYGILFNRLTAPGDAGGNVVESGMCGEDLSWTLDETGTLTIKGSGEMYDYDRGPWESFAVRRAVLEAGITSIGRHAFENCYFLTSVTMPQGINAIGECAFKNCKLIEAIEVPSGVASIEEDTFSGCCSLKRITLQEGMINIGDNAFVGCSALTDVMIPDGVLQIGSSAFSGCESLTEVKIPDQVTEIGNEAFYECSRLKSILIPSGVTRLGERAFALCNSLVNVTMSSGITAIEDETFYDCSSLENVMIPENVTSIGNKAFYDCERLKDVTISESVTSIGYSAFHSCCQLRSVNIPAGVTSIGNMAFSYCRNLSNIVIPEGILTIGYGTFEESGLKSVEIPDGVTSIGANAFFSCRSLSSAIIPSSVSSIAGNAFLCYDPETDYNVPMEHLVICGIPGSYAEDYAEGWSIVFKDINTVTSIENAIVTVDDQKYIDDVLEPVPVVVLEGKTLTADIDYRVSYTNNYDVGTATAAIIGIGSYYGATEATFTIQKADQIIEAEDLSIEYLRKCKINVTGAIGKLSFTSSDDAVASVSSIGRISANGAGTAKITITAAATRCYNAAEKEITVTVIMPEGKKKEQNITVSDLFLTYPNGGKIQVSGAEGTLAFESKNSDIITVDASGWITVKGAGTAIVTISAAETDEYLPASREITVVVAKADQTITASDLSLTYPDGGKITVSGNNGALSFTSSSTAVAAVDENGNITARGAGTATIKITAAGTDNYNPASKDVTVTIAKASQSITAKASAASVAVGKTVTVKVTGAQGKVSYKSADTSVATVNASTGVVTAKKVGTVRITATAAATANYKAASKTVTIKVVPAATAKITAANLAKGIKLTYKKVAGANGYIIYRNGTKVRTISSSSTLTWTDTAANANGTKYTYKIVAKASTGASTLSKSLVTYRVARPALSSAANSAAGKMTIKWAKNAKATGYQVQYSTSKDFTDGNKAVSVTKAATVSKVITGLTKGKTYYVRIRTCKTVGSTKYWSAWSAAKSVKISK